MNPGEYQDGDVHGLRHLGPASPSAAARLRRRLVRWAREEGVGADTTDDIGLACYEAMVNTVVHAYPPGTVGPMELHARLDPGSVEVTVADRGQWPSDDSRAGHGLQLINKLSEQAEIVHGNYGTTVRMRWQRNAA